MWIRSQDKEALIPINKMITNTCEGLFYDGTILGVYKSKERAIEVLYEIQKAIIENEVCKLYATMGDMTIFNKNKMKFTPVYEMPKE